MAILTRVGRLLTADLHAVIDRLEEPQAQLQQAMREMQQLTVQLQTEQQRRETSLTHLAEQRQALVEQQATTKQELELCLDADEAVLARAVVRRSLQLDKRLEHVDKELKLGHAQHKQRAEVLAEQQSQLETLTAQAQLLEISLTDSGSSQSSGNPAASGITEAQIDIALLAHQQRRARS